MGETEREREKQSVRKISIKHWKSCHRTLARQENPAGRNGGDGERKRETNTEEDEV